MSGYLLLVEAVRGCGAHLGGAAALTGLEIVVVGATEAREAIRSRPSPPTVIVLAGTGDDWALARALKAMPGVEGVPMVGVGEAAQPGESFHASRAGCAKFIDEPCTAAELAVAVETLLSPTSRATTRPSSPDASIGIPAPRPPPVRVPGAVRDEPPEDRAAKLMEEGRADGLRRAILMTLSARAIALSAAGQATLAACTDTDVLTSWLTRALTATSEREILGDENPR